MLVCKIFSRFENSKFPPYKNNCLNDCQENNQLGRHLFKIQKSTTVIASPISTLYTKLYTPQPFFAITIAQTALIVTEMSETTAIFLKANSFISIVRCISSKETNTMLSPNNCNRGLIDGLLKKEAIPADEI